MQDGQADFYADASLYDILHTPGTAREVDAVVRTARAFGALPTRGLGVWLEPACGSGRCLRVLARRGARVYGFDLAPGMLDYARARAERLGVGARSTYFRGDMTGFAHAIDEPVHVAFNLINTVRHLPTDRAMLAHFAEVARVLAPGGVYLVGLSTTLAGGEPPTEDVWRARRGVVRVKQVVQYVPPPEFGQRVERVISHVVRTTPTREDHHDASYDLRTYTRGQWLGLVGRSALEVAGVADALGDETAAPELGYAVYALRARG